MVDNRSNPERGVFWDGPVSFHGPLFPSVGVLSGMSLSTLPALLVPEVPEKRHAFPGRSSARMPQAI